jgi:hypothetical protein
MRAGVSPGVGDGGAEETEDEDAILDAMLGLGGAEEGRPAGLG